MHSLAKGVLEYLTPVLKESKFDVEGVLTPEEFVAAGDLLVYKCPTWQWEAGDKDKQKPYLPPHKQYLITRNVPCEQRVHHLHTGLQDEDRNEDGDGEWVSTHIQREEQKSKLNIPDMNEALIHDLNALQVSSNPIKNDESKGVNLTNNNSTNQNDDEESIPDMEEYNDNNNIFVDPANLAQSYVIREEPDNILKTRTYDLSITYDKYYQTPRFWLFGYNEHNQPLTQEQVFEDISQDHARKTVTIEPHPHTSIPHAGIHPCRHAATMKRIISAINPR
eukprot:c2507_g1_i1.p1 GENE.c2507_g1_i1~~c2507_g1_i1.p1  ORF type:complete len:278 (-),score=87.71 c2507_g1_i1:4-837(-)